MLCSKKGCNKKILSGEEVQIKGTIICKECSQEPIAYCFTCSPEWPLYNNDRIHEISRNSGKDYNIWVLLTNVKRSRSEKITQCDDCYQEWKKEQEKEDKKWWKKDWLSLFLSILLVISLGLAVYLFYPNSFERLKNNAEITIVFASCLIIPLFFTSKVLFEGDDRFKTRKRKANSTKK